MLDPDAVAGRTFGTSFRGYDPEEVRRFLVQVAADLRALAHGALEGIDDDRATALLGEEAGRILGAARSSAAAVEARARDTAAEVLREAQDEAVRLRATVDAERERAYTEGAARAEEALAEAERVSTGMIDTARADADRLLAEATAAREHVLRDLAKRRKAIRTQIEQLHAAREKLLQTLAEVSSFVEESRGRLVVALPEAKLAADAAARRAGEEPETTVEQLESELEAFRLVGLALGEAAAEAEAHEEAAGEPEEPVPDPAAIVEGRKSSSLRVFRSRRDPVPAIGVGEPELHEVSPSEPYEEVKVLEPEAGEPPDVAAEVEAVPEPEPVPQPEPVIAGAAEAEPEEEPVLDAGAVDELFARLRAGREARVEAAEAVLAAELVVEDEADPESATEPEPEPATEPEPAVDEAPVHIGGAPDRAELLARRDELLAAPTADLLRRFKRLLADEQNQVLDALRRGGVAPGAVTAPDELVPRWAEEATPDLSSAAAAGAGFLDAAGVAAGLDDVAAELAEAVASPLAERLVAAVERADGDHDLAADGVRAVYREWRSQRLADSVDHAVRAAFGRGALAAAEATGAKLCWVVDDGGSPCPDAEDNALAGSLTAGDPFPTGHRHPPAHPGCRCVLALST